MFIRTTPCSYLVGRIWRSFMTNEKTVFKTLKTYAQFLAILSLASCGRAEFGLFGPNGTDNTSNVAKAEVALSAMNDQFEISNQAKQVDVLFVMDNSASMTEEQQSVVNSFSKFLNGFTQKGIDYQIGVVSTDQITAERDANWWKERYADFPNVGPGSLLARKGNSRFIKSDHGRAETLRSFRENIRLGVNGSGSESGLLAVTRALSHGFLKEGGFNHGFVRPDSLLSVILVSDEDDSVGNADKRYSKLFPEFEEKRIQNFLTVLKAVKPDRPDRIRLDLVISPVNEQCKTGLEKGETYSKAFQKLYAGANEISGKILNICTDFSDQLGDLGGQIASQVERRFRLKAQVGGPMVVKLNGVEISVSASEGYTFNPATNEILINGMGLEKLSTFKVEVSYPGRAILE
jgi:hypothetical protein